MHTCTSPKHRKGCPMPAAAVAFKLGSVLTPENLAQLGGDASLMSRLATEGSLVELAQEFGEITDPDEVEYFSSIPAQSKSPSASRSGRRSRMARACRSSSRPHTTLGSAFGTMGRRSACTWKGPTPKPRCPRDSRSNPLRDWGRRPLGPAAARATPKSQHDAPPDGRSPPSATSPLTGFSAEPHHRNPLQP